MMPFDRLDGLIRVVDPWRFAASRADYYDYLAALMDGMQGRRSLRDIFHADAYRYGQGSVRGRLSLRWSHAYQVTGGDLYSTWLGCFPLAELGLIRAAQSLGNTALINTLHDLADALALIEQVKNILRSTLSAAALGLALLISMVVAVPLFTVPRLQRTFYSVPTEFYGESTRSLIYFSGLVASHWPLMLVLLVGGAALLVWSLPNLSGAVRQWLEKWALWRVYRCINALRFLGLLTIVLARQSDSSMQLRTALAMQKAGGSRWQHWHIDAMLDRIDTGVVGARSFDTGLLDQDLFWFFCDMAEARGLAAGLALTRERLKRSVLTTIARQALVLRWCSLLVCVACLIALGLWHYAVIDELRRALMLFYASQ